MFYLRAVKWFFPLLLLPQLVLAGSAYYVYQLPDGSRLITDKRQYQSSYKLVWSSREVKGIGRVVANKFRRGYLIRFHQYEDMIHDIARHHGVDAALVTAVIHTESYFNPEATSHKGASGLMQLMPATAAHYGVKDLYNPRQNIDAGVRYLRDLLDKYRDRLSFALAAYNAGETAVNKYNGIPPYPETQNYVSKVMQHLEYYSYWQ